MKDTPTTQQEDEAMTKRGILKCAVHDTEVRWIGNRSECAQCVAEREIKLAQVQKFETLQPATHTPTPWKITTATNGDIYIGGHEWVLRMVDKVDFTTMPKEANAAFILRACNYNQILINIAKNLHSVFQKGCPKNCETCETIANAEGK